MKRLSIFFFYDAQGIVDRYVDHFLCDLKKNCAHLLVVCNGLLTDEGRATLLKNADELLVRENSGFDIWAYKTALEHLTWEKIEKYDEIVLCNFTVFGPLYPFKEMFSEMETRELDFWGITKFNKVNYDPFGTISYNYIPPHLQSNFIAIRKRLFMSSEYRAFWENMTPVNTYQEAIGKYEAVFTKKFADLGFKWDTYVPMDDLTETATQPLLFCSRELVENRRCPIIKRRMFFQSHFDILSETDGTNCRKTMEYIEKNCDYDTGMIWENLLRCVHMDDIKCAMGLNYILPSNFCGAPSASKTALIFHLYFADQIPYCKRFMANMPDNCDLFIGTSSEEIRQELLRLHQELTRGKLDVRVVPNRGRDLGTLLIEFKDEVPKYDYICFAHDKKAGQVKPQGIGLTFRDKCFENTLGSKEYVQNIIRTFDENPRLGLLTVPPPNHGPYHFTLKNSWSVNFPLVLEWAEKLGLNVPLSPFKMPVAPLGSFFWFRAKAYKTMLSYPWRYEDFPPEPLPDDGTLLHALERLRPFAVQHDGFYSAWVMNDDYARTEFNNTHFMLSECVRAIDSRSGNFQGVIFELQSLRNTLKPWSRNWFKMMANRYIPVFFHPFCKRLYQTGAKVGRYFKGREKNQ